jgi:hypothetical protein
MFKGIITIKPFVTVLSMTEVVYHTAVFKATSNGLAFRMKNDNYKEMLDLMLPREAFMQYEYKGTDTFFAFRPAEVLRFFDGIDNGNIELHTDGNIINIKYETASKTLDFTTKSSTDSIVVDDDVVDIEQIPNFTPVVKLLVRRELLLDAIERVGIERYFKLTIDSNGLGFRQVSVDRLSMYSIFYKYGKDISMKMFTEAMTVIEAYHDVLTLVPILKAVPDCNYVMLYSDKDGNLRFEFLLPFKCNANYYVCAVQQPTTENRDNY